jgi:hypothetical protein
MHFSFRPLVSISGHVGVLGETIKALSTFFLIFTNITTRQLFKNYRFSRRPRNLAYIIYTTLKRQTWIRSFIYFASNRILMMTSRKLDVSRRDQNSILSIEAHFVGPRVRRHGHRNALPFVSNSVQHCGESPTG